MSLVDKYPIPKDKHTNMSSNSFSAGGAIESSPADIWRARRGTFAERCGLTGAEPGYGVADTGSGSSAVNGEQSLRYPWTESRCVEMPGAFPSGDSWTRDDLTPPSDRSWSHSQTNTTTSEESRKPNPRIGEITYLAELPNADVARQMMLKIETDILPIMEKWNWDIDKLAEFYPDNQKLLGDNTENGRLVRIRLREADDVTVFRALPAIMSTMVHELCHNMYTQHSADFYAMWYRINCEYGIKGGEALMMTSAIPATKCPTDQIAIAVCGKKVMMKRVDFQKHFSIFARGISGRTDVVQMPRKYEADIVVRLIQLAKGLDPADETPLISVPNGDDYYDEENECMAVQDKYEKAGIDVYCAIKLYVRMYKTGKQLGMHSTTERWLMDRLSRTLHCDPRTRCGPWHETQLMTEKDATTNLCKMAYLVYDETTSDDQPVRDIVATLLKFLVTKRRRMKFSLDLDVICEQVSQYQQIGRDMELL